ncbi:conserved unknown protein [Ectocarpus siliculosus]|uniref:Pentacotripeptide-repeat region of PRORP domain-containing protein n=1 Tax=Ectocarpus siliculosus TaxID=2880 RepID=D7FLV0_ECTSI|nr:conserved unknown protein [Ectocarpus siliculosus]|eukprot:CBJ29786.1 conserved unknown protein [Ectocarpus siliculosus]
MIFGATHAASAAIPVAAGGTGRLLHSYGCCCAGRRRSTTTSLLGEKEEAPAGQWEEEEEDSSTVSSRLQDVVSQLQGELRAGTTPQVRSSIKLDSLFADLRGQEDTSRGRNSKTPTTTGPKTIPPKSPKQPRRLPSGKFCAAGSGDAALQETDDLESLSNMLDRVQASAKARDLAEAEARSLELRSGGPIGDDPARSWVTIGNQRDMKTRFRNIREGRVGWAVLPLVMKAKQAGIPLSTGVYNAAIAAYSGTPRKYEDALRVLNMLRREEDPGVRPDLGSYNAAMWVCSEAGQWRLVMELMTQAREEGIEPDTTSYNNAMRGMAIQKQWRRARKLLKRMVSEGLSPDVRTYNGLVEAAGMGSAAPRKHMIEVVHEMEQAGVEPNSYTFTTLLNCLARRRKIFDGFQVMARLVDARAPLLPHGHRAGLQFCDAYGDWRRAMILMEDMRVAKRRPSGPMYLLAVKACAKGAQWERALSLMVERRALDVREEKEANEKNGGKPLQRQKMEAAAKAKKQAARTHMKTLEVVLSAVSEAGQFEVAMRLVQQMRAAGGTPSKKCYLYTLRAASKWGRWDVIESLMKDMRALRVGVVAEKETDAMDDGVVVNNGEGKGGGGEQHRPRMLSSDCYAPLVEAYAQASMWERAIEAYQEGFVVGREGGEAGPVKYRVFECVLKACVEVSDGRTALEVIGRQAAEPKALQKLSSAITTEGEGKGTELSGGPPDRRCWCLAAEALGRAGMIQEGHRVLMAMVDSGIPLRESTKTDVPSLMPLPTTGGGGFEWDQRRRRRHPRRRRRRRRHQQQGAPGLPPPAAMAEMQEAVVRERLGLFSSREDGTGGGSALTGGPRESRNAVQVSKSYLSGMEFPKGVVNGEGCTAAAVAAATNGGEKTLGMGWLLANDLASEKSEMERDVQEGGLERKRRRMREFSLKRREQQKKLERICTTGAGYRSGRLNGGLPVGKADDAGVGVTAGLDLRPGGRRGRNEALTLRMRVRGRRMGILRSFRGANDRPRRKERVESGGGGGGGSGDGARPEVL